MKLFFLLSVVIGLSAGSALIRAEDSAKSKHAKQTAAKTTTSQPANIVKTAANAGQFKTLLSLLIAAELDDALKGDGPFTVFAPTDAAFAQLPKGTLETLLKPENQAQLQAILSYHVIPKKARLNFEFANSQQNYDFKTLNGSNVKLYRGDGIFLVNDAKILNQNIVCSNGSIQVIDAVLLPGKNEQKTRNTIISIA